MGCKNNFCIAGFSVLVLFMFVPLSAVQMNGQAEEDPHRPPCTSSQCQKIKSFLKAHYCGESPFGNGPDDGCDIRVPKKPAPVVTVKADFECKYSEAENKSKCEQRGEVSPSIRRMLVRELRKIGLPEGTDRQLYFMVWEVPAAGSSVAMADYHSVSGLDLMLCRVILIIEQSSQIHVLRKLPYQKTNVDVPEGTTWSPIDVSDVNGDGHLELILEGDSYEDHWLEVDRVQDDSPHTIFSGLGYYL